ncbi:uncharacterized protein [Arachis hypogaea]|uniref:uncharacterized protein n=1 Tax=Arachis hypogaea TaxID=3818 RepID=UPI000DECE73F|nr:uncharacterized protein LOC112729980 [Arachis hypogaea]
MDQRRSRRGHDRLFQDYFADEPVYNADIFRWIVDALSNVYPYFQQRVNATRRRGLSPLQKCTTAIWMLAYGVAADAVDDYVSFRCSRMNTYEKQIQLMYDACYKWRRVVAFLACWIWHAFFGVSSSNNDINVLDRSPVFDDILNDHAPKLQGEKRKLFAQYQQGQRKDVERAFEVLQARFAIIRGPARFWEKKKLANIMRACIILHNMIIDDERDTYVGNFAQGLEYDDVENDLSQPQLGEEDFAPYLQFL